MNDIVVADSTEDEDEYYAWRFNAHIGIQGPHKLIQGPHGKRSLDLMET